MPTAFKNQMTLWEEEPTSYLFAKAVGNGGAHSITQEGPVLSGNDPVSTAFFLDLEAALKPFEEAWKTRVGEVLYASAKIVVGQLQRGMCRDDRDDLVSEIIATAYDTALAFEPRARKNGETMLLKDYCFYLCRLRFIDAKRKLKAARRMNGKVVFTEDAELLSQARHLTYEDADEFISGMTTEAPVKVQPAPVLSAKVEVLKAAVRRILES